MKKLFLLFFFILLNSISIGVTSLPTVGIFTPIGHTVPSIFNENPSNGSIIRVTSYNWNVEITDYVPFNWTIECSDGNSSIGNMSTNGTFYLNLTNLITYTTYTVWVNVTDVNASMNASFIFTVMPPSSTGGTNPGGGGAYISPTDTNENNNPAPTTQGNEYRMEIYFLVIFVSAIFLISAIIGRKK